MPWITPQTNLFDWTIQQVENKPAIKEAVVHLLQYADFQIDNFEILSDKLKNKEIFFNHTSKNEQGHSIQIPFKPSQESQGTLRYFGLGGVLAMLMTEAKAILIDEFETSLHPDLAQNFILRFLAHAQKAQLLITTHQIDFLGQADILRRDALWFTQKNEQGIYAKFCKRTNKKIFSSFIVKKSLYLQQNHYQLCSLHSDLRIFCHSMQNLNYP